MNSGSKKLSVTLVLFKPAIQSQQRLNCRINKDSESQKKGIQWQIPLYPHYKENRTNEKAHRFNEPDTGWPDVRPGL